MSGSNFSLKYQDRQITVTKNGGTLLSFKNQNQEILYQGSSSKRTGIPILFPFANPLENGIFRPSGKEIPQHGFARNSVFEIIQPNNHSLELVLNHKAISPEMREAYAYDFELKIILNLAKENTLIYKMIVTNLDQKDLPIAPGIHPYFPLKHKQKPKLQIENLDLQKIDWEIPSNGYFYDFEGSAKIKFDQKNLTVKETSSKKEFQNLVVWSQIPSGNEDFDFVCVEPFTRKTNAINDSPILVKPSQNWEVSLEFVVAS